MKHHYKNGKSQNFYVALKGRQIGIFENWIDCNTESKLSFNELISDCDLTENRSEPFKW